MQLNFDENLTLAILLIGVFVTILTAIGVEAHIRSKELELINSATQSDNVVMYIK